MKLRIAHLYPDFLNLYGDFGNIIAIKYRSQLRHIDIEYSKITLGSKFNHKDFDFFFIGGGQDEQQHSLMRDIFAKKFELQEAVELGKPVLAICGGFQLLGEYFITNSGKKIDGLNILPIYTEGQDIRMIGDTIYDAKWLQEAEGEIFQEPGDNYLLGFENHSGNTILTADGYQLANVIKGFGNNSRKKYEGCKYKNIIGTYAHGSFLPKNPAMTDFLIYNSLKVKYADFTLTKADRKIENIARLAAAKRLGFSLK